MRIVFAGTPEFALPSLEALLASPHQVVAVYTQPDRPAGRGRQLTASPVKQRALAAGIAVHQPVTLKSSEEQARLAALAPDVMVVVAYGLLLPQAVLDIPQWGCINVHASLLPRWRGAAPIQRAIIAGDRESGVTIMRMSLQLDAGDMLRRVACAIPPDMTAGELHDLLARCGAEILVPTLEDWVAGRITPEPQAAEGVTYAEKLSKHEAQLDWTQAAVQLERWVRGLNPWPVAETRYRGQPLRIWRASAWGHDAPDTPGRVRVDRERHLDVATGDGWLRLHEVQLPGGKRLAARDFLNAHAIDGELLG